MITTTREELLTLHGLKALPEEAAKDCDHHQHLFVYDHEVDARGLLTGRHTMTCAMCGKLVKGLG